MGLVNSKIRNYLNQSKETTTTTKGEKNQNRISETYKAKSNDLAYI